MSPLCDLEEKLGFLSRWRLEKPEYKIWKLKCPAKEVHNNWQPSLFICLLPFLEFYNVVTEFIQTCQRSSPMVFNVATLYNQIYIEIFFITCAQIFQAGILIYSPILSVLIIFSMSEYELVADFVEKEQELFGAMGIDIDIPKFG